MAEVGRVLIVGGGIGGLSLATALQRRGCAAELVERSPAWPALGAGSRCTPTACGCCGGSGWGRRSTRRRRSCAAGASTTSTEPRCGHHADPLQEILLAGAAPVPHRLGVAVTAVAADTDRVSVGFSDGTSGDYDLVVGADGIHRPV